MLTKEDKMFECSSPRKWDEMENIGNPSNIHFVKISLLHLTRAYLKKKILKNQRSLKMKLKIRIWKLVYVVVILKVLWLN